MSRVRLTNEELDKFFELNEKIKAMAQEIAPLCTNIKSHESVEAILEHGDEDIGILVWSDELGHDGYAFPRQYLFMSDSEIKADLKRKQMKR